MYKNIVMALLCLLFGQQLLAAEYTVAVRAIRGTDMAVKQWQPTIDLLNRQLSPDRFNLQPVISLNELTLRAGKGEYDFVLTNPSSFVEIEQLHHAKALATLNNKRADTAQDHFGSVIFTHVRNENIKQIKDLTGKTLMAVSESAFGGWRVAWLEMLKQGFDPHKELKQLLFANSKTQPEVVMAVLEGRADAGVVRTDLLERMEQQGKVDMRYLRIINNKNIKDFPFFLSTELYPEWPFAALQSVPVELALQVKTVLLAIGADSEAAQQGQYIGWVEPGDYSSVQSLMQQLKVGPYAQ